MKVVHLVPAMEQGGVESVVCDLNRVLTKAGWESVVISKGGRLVERIERDGGQHLLADLKSKNPLTYISRVLKLRRLLRAEKPDLVCVHSRVPAWLYLGVRTLDSKIQTSKHSNISSLPPWITYAHGANSVSKYSEVMTKGDLIVTPSRFLADYLKANYGTPEKKIRIVPNAVDAVRFNPDNLDQAFIAEKRREWGIQDGDRVIMSVGRITKVKGLDSLIRDFAKLCRRGVLTASEKKDSVLADAEGTPRPQKLIIVGGADKHHLQYLESLESLARSLFPPTPHPSSLTSHPSPVIFAGPQTRIPECLFIADEVVSANTTKPESFGLSIVEAYAMNKPVRANRFGGAAEVMEAVEKSSKPSLREAVLSLYGIDLFAERTLGVYRELVNMI